MYRSDFNMSYSIIKVEKFNYENEDIDHSKKHLNYDLINDGKQNFNDLIDEKIERNYTGKRKIRKDAVKHIDGMITSDNKFFSNQTLANKKIF